MIKKLMVLLALLGLSIIIMACDFGREYSNTNNIAQEFEVEQPSYTPKWHTWVDKKKIIEKGEASGQFGVLEDNDMYRTVKYSIKSTGKVDAYWVQSKADFELLVNKLEFSYDTSCSSTSVTEFNSGTCRVRSESGLVIVNKENRKVEVDILIEQFGIRTKP